MLSSPPSMEHKEFQRSFARRGSVHPTGASPHAKEDLHHPEAKIAAPHRQFSGISHSTPLLAQYTCSPGGGKKRKGLTDPGIGDKREYPSQGFLLGSMFNVSKVL